MFHAVWLNLGLEDVVKLGWWRGTFFLQYWVEEDKAWQHFSLWHWKRRMFSSIDFALVKWDHFCMLSVLNVNVWGYNIWHLSFLLWKPNYCIDMHQNDTKVGIVKKIIIPAIFFFSTFFCILSLIYSELKRWFCFFIS